MKKITFLPLALLTSSIGILWFGYSANYQALPAYADSFSMMGNWRGSPDCPITFYKDDGRDVEGNCDNGSYNHIIRGSYSRRNPNRISTTITRIDPNRCETSVSGYIEVINNNHVKSWQTGWDGCGVRTQPGTQDWYRIVTRRPPRPEPRQACPTTFSPRAFQGRTGKVAFYNEWNMPVTVVLYHPNSSSVYNRYTVPPGQNQLLGNNIIVGDDWGVCFENKPGASDFVNNLGTISDYNNHQGSPLFMIQNGRIR
jgi:hypothetical protein